MNPSVFNMRKVREAKVPAANGHASAYSLARVFDAVIRGGADGPILSKETLDMARTPSYSRNVDADLKANNPQQAMLNDATAKFGLGFQLHEFKGCAGQRCYSIGHSGLGGSLVLALPEEEVVVALTLNQLSTDSIARRRVLGIVFDELGLKPPESLPVEVISS